MVATFYSILGGGNGTELKAPSVVQGTRDQPGPEQPDEGRGVGTAAASGDLGHDDSAVAERALPAFEHGAPGELARAHAQRVTQQATQALFGDLFGHACLSWVRKRRWPG